MATGLGKAARLKNLTLQAQFLQGTECAPPAASLREEELAASTWHAGCSTTRPATNAHRLVSPASLCNCSDLKPRSRELG